MARHIVHLLAIGAIAWNRISSIWILHSTRKFVSQNIVHFGFLIAEQFWDNRCVHASARMQLKIPFTRCNGYTCVYVASFIKEGNPRLAKRPLVFNGRLANHG